MAQLCSCLSDKAIHRAVLNLMKGDIQHVFRYWRQDGMFLNINVQYMPHNDHPK